MKKKYKYILLVFLVLGIHTATSWSVLLIATSSSNFLLFFILPFIYGALTGLVFFYLFSHDKVVKIAKLIEEKEQKIEKKWLKRFAHSGKLLTTLIIGVFGGPILCALTVKLFYSRSRYKYVILLTANLLSTIYFVLVLKGVVKLVIASFVG